MNGNLQTIWGLSPWPPYPTPVHISSHVAYSSTPQMEQLGHQKISNYLPD